MEAYGTTCRTRSQRRWVRSTGQHCWIGHIGPAVLEPSAWVARTCGDPGDAPLHFAAAALPMDELAAVLQQFNFETNGGNVSATVASEASQ